MADIATIARPYAKAIFNLNEDSSLWTKSLKTLVQIASVEGFLSWVSHPKTNKEDVLATVGDVLNKEKFPEKHIQHVLSLVKQLLLRRGFVLIEEIEKQFIQLWQKSQATIEIQVETAFELSDVEHKHLLAVLEKDLNKKVVLQTSVDKHLIGGVKLSMGDLVLDNSMQNQLSRLKNQICAAN